MHAVQLRDNLGPGPGPPSHFPLSGGSGAEGLHMYIREGTAKQASKYVCMYVRSIYIHTYVYTVALDTAL